MFLFSFISTDEDEDEGPAAAGSVFKRSGTNSFSVSGLLTAAEALRCAQSYRKHRSRAFKIKVYFLKN